MMSRNSISRTSPGRAPLTKTGPVSGWMAPASIHGDDGLNVRMKPVVAGRWLISQALAAVDLDGLHGLSSCRLRSHHGRHVPARLRHPRKRPVGLRRLPDSAEPRPGAHDLAASSRGRGRHDRTHARRRCARRLVSVGSAFARLGAALETKVISCDPYVDDQRFAALGVERVSLDTLAERADYVSVHTLLSAETRHLIGEAFFRRMKPTAILINTSRGPVVDEKALARALQEKRLAGAALDVWEQEPVAPDNPLLTMDNVIATPHAAYFSSPAVAQVPRRCGEEVARVLTGQRPLNVVNPEVYAPGAVRRAR